MLKFLPLILALSALPLSAQTAPNLADAPQAAAPGPVATLSAALRLYALAEAQGDALAMAVAARLATGIDLRKPTLWEQATEKAKPPAPAGNATGITLSQLRGPEAMAGALLMAEEDEVLADVLASLPPLDPRARRGGASLAEVSLKAGQQDLWTIPLPGQSLAEIAVLPDGSGDPLWRVEDADGHPVCPERRASTALACAFTPAENGFFRVIVTAGEEAAYVLLTN